MLKEQSYYLFRAGWCIEVFGLILCLCVLQLGKQNFDDLKLEVEIGGKRFSEIPLMRLSNLAAYVNQKLGSEKYSLVLAFETLHMPLKQLPSNVHSLLQKELLAIGEPALADYFVMCLQMAVEEHSKGLFFYSLLHSSILCSQLRHPFYILKSSPFVKPMIKMRLLKLVPFYWFLHSAHLPR